MKNEINDDISKGFADVIDGFIDWFELLTWHIGYCVILIIRFDFGGIPEIMYWMKMHMTYKGKKIGTVKLPIKRRIKNVIINMLGWFVIALVLTMIIKSIKTIL